MADACSCPWTPSSSWLVHFGAVEPGSQRELDPRCPIHGQPPAPLEVPC